MTIEPVLAARFSKKSGVVGKGSSGLKADEVCRINSEKPDVHRGAKLVENSAFFNIRVL